MYTSEDRIRADKLFFRLGRLTEGSLGVRSIKPSRSAIPSRFFGTYFRPINIPLASRDEVFAAGEETIPGETCLQVIYAAKLSPYPGGSRPSHSVILPPS